MAHIKATATTKGNRDSKPKNLGVKKFGGEKVVSGNIIIRQKGSKFNPGEGTRMGNDYTIYAVKSGVVTYLHKRDKIWITIK